MTPDDAAAPSRACAGVAPPPVVPPTDDRSRRGPRNNAHRDAREAEAPPRMTGTRRGYSGKATLNMSDMRLRAALSLLARDVDPEARRTGVRLAEEAMRLLDGITRRAEEASTPYARAQERAAQLVEQLDRLRSRTAPAGPKPPPDTA